MESEGQRIFPGKPLYTEAYNNCKWDDIEWLTKNFKPDWLDAIVNYWAWRLRIQDWNIRYGWSSPYDMKTGESGIPVQASVRLWAQDRTADIDLLEFKGLHPRVENYDFEGVIVHEFLHIVMWQWSMSSMNEEQFWHHEAVIHDLTNALLMEHRGLVDENKLRAGEKVEGEGKMVESVIESGD